MTQKPNKEVYYFLGNITSHISHALPLYKQLGGTFLVLSTRAKKEVEKYNVPVINIDNKPYQWTHFSRWVIKPNQDYMHIGPSLKKTIDFLNNNAKVVIFYELYDFAPTARLTTPKTIFLTHGYMLKDYMNSSGRVEKLHQYDYMAALGPFLKNKFIKNDHIDTEKLVNVGLARTDEIVVNTGKIIMPGDLAKSGKIDPSKRIISYLPTFWGPSSIYTVGKEIVRNFPDDYTLIFRPHPQTPRKILKEYLKIIHNKSNIIYAPENKYPDLGISEIIAASSGVIGDVSSVMLEAILADKPLLFAFDTAEHRQPKSDYAAIRDVVDYSAKIDIENVSKLPGIIKKSLNLGINKNIWQATKSKNFYDYHGESAKHIADFIRSII